MGRLHDEYKYRANSGEHAWLNLVTTGLRSITATTSAMLCMPVSLGLPSYLLQGSHAPSLGFIFVSSRCYPSITLDIAANAHTILAPQMTINI